MCDMHWGRGCPLAGCVLFFCAKVFSQTLLLHLLSPMLVHAVTPANSSNFASALLAGHSEGDTPQQPGSTQGSSGSQGRAKGMSRSALSPPRLQWLDCWQVAMLCSAGGLSGGGVANTLWALAQLGGFWWANWGHIPPPFWLTPHAVCQDGL